MRNASGNPTARAVARRATSFLVVAVIRPLPKNASQSASIEGRSTTITRERKDAAWQLGKLQTLFSTARRHTIMSILLQGVTTVLAADFVSGFVHWAEDAYARRDTPVIGKLIANANIEHHKKPRAFIERNWFESSWDLLAAGTLVIAAAWAMHALTWQVWLFVLIAINANQIHVWAHRNPRENGVLVTFLQKIRLLQTQRHHAHHHSGQKDDTIAQSPTCSTRCLTRCMCGRPLNASTRWCLG